MTITEIMTIMGMTSKKATAMMTGMSMKMVTMKPMATITVMIMPRMVIHMTTTGMIAMKKKTATMITAMAVMMIMAMNTANMRKVKLKFHLMPPN